MSNTIGTETLPAGTWTIDPAHSEIGFTVRHLMAKVRGSFNQFSGTVVTEGGDPLDSTVNVEIAMASVDTRNEMRDNHLRSAEIFNVDEDPKMTFASTGIAAADGGYVITGDLTLHGVTRPVELKAEFLGAAVDAYGVTRLGAEASTTINRKDFGVDFNVPLDGGKLLLGDQIQVTIDLQATQA